MNLDIRKAQPPDVALLLEFYKQLDTAPEPEMPIEQARARFLELVSDPRYDIYVASSHATVVGTFALTFVGGISHGARDSCIVEDVVVAAQAQGRGVGREMMRFAMALCAERDCYKLVLSSHLIRGQAHRFYEGLGFRRHGYSYLIDPRPGPADVEYVDPQVGGRSPR